jgi:hypothetical protein
VADLHPKTLSEKDRADFQKTFNRRREIFLDSSHGRCLLKRPELARMVADSLLHFDGQRYRMGDFVVMPKLPEIQRVMRGPTQSFRGDL